MLSFSTLWFSFAFVTLYSFMVAVHEGALCNPSPVTMVLQKQLCTVTITRRVLVHLQWFEVTSWERGSVTLQSLWCKLTLVMNVTSFFPHVSLIFDDRANDYAYDSASDQWPDRTLGNSNYCTIAHNSIQFNNWSIPIWPQPVTLKAGGSGVTQNDVIIKHTHKWRLEVHT